MQSKEEIDVNLEKLVYYTNMSRERRKMYFVKMNSVDMVKIISNTSYVIKHLVVLGDDDLYKIYFNWAIPFF
ncbi:MAG: hypothetical protein HFE81_01750 [Bacilli bacterium]|nr:hypothetical protein [Bacilli bacterium]